MRRRGGARTGPQPRRSRRRRRRSRVGVGCWVARGECSRRLALEGCRAVHKETLERKNPTHDRLVASLSARAVAACGVSASMECGCGALACWRGCVMMMMMMAMSEH
eukprot:372919-Rhodomonas_salina.2